MTFPSFIIKHTATVGSAMMDRSPTIPKLLLSPTRVIEYGGGNHPVGGRSKNLELKFCLSYLILVFVNIIIT